MWKLFPKFALYFNTEIFNNLVMKKHFSLAFTLALLTVIAFGCKVGADDPASLASRDGRLIRGWKLISIAGLSTDVTTVLNITTNSSTTTTYSGTLLTEIDNPGQTSTATYSLEYVIDKAGVLSGTEVNDGAISTFTGNWEWLNNDKNKSELMLNGDVFTVTRLSSKELVLDQYSKSSYTDTGYSNTSEDKATWTFEAK